MVSHKSGRDQLKIEEESVESTSSEENEEGDVTDDEREDEDEPVAKKRLLAASADAVSFKEPARKIKKKPKKLTKREAKEKLLAKHEKARVGFVAPDYAADRERESQLRRVATTGVVQLFNAVADRQRKLDEELKKKTGSKLKKTDLGEFRPEKYKVKEEDEESDTVDDLSDDIKQESFDDLDASFKTDTSEVKQELDDFD